jgi:hypothetical protein
MAPRVEASDDGALFIGSDANSAVIKGGIFLKHAHNHHSNNKWQIQKRGYVSYLDKRESTTNSQMLLRRSWK